MVTEKLIAVDRLTEKKEMTVDWFLGRRCNFDCSYCTPDIHDSTSPHIPLDYLKSIADVLVESIDAEKLKISFTGGEPTVHPSYLDLCKYLNSLKVKGITTTTNLTRRVDYYIELLQYTKSLTISHHFEYENTVDFLEKVKSLFHNKPKHARVRVQVMFHDKYFEPCKQAVQFYKENGIPYTLRRIRNKGKITSGSEYTQEQIDWFLKNQPQDPDQANAVIFYRNSSQVVEHRNVHVNEISGSLKNNFNGWVCNAGIDHIYISGDGLIYRGNCHQGELLGSVDQKLVLPTEPVVCQTNRCFCAPEISIRKYSPDVNINEINFTD